MVNPHDEAWIEAVCRHAAGAHGPPGWDAEADERAELYSRNVWRIVGTAVAEALDMAHAARRHDHDPTQPR